MDLVIVIAMLAIGGIVALAVGTSIAAAQRESGSSTRPAAPPDRNHVAASLLFNLLLAGGAAPDQALRAIRRVGLIALVTSSIDIRNWGERFAQIASPEQLAKLRDKYGFDYIDHAKDARPREADRAGGATPLFVRQHRDDRELLRVLEIEGPVSREVIIAAYRRLAAQHHPDRFFAESADVQSAAAARFIEITSAYQALLALYPDEGLVKAPVIE